MNNCKFSQIWWRAGLCLGSLLLVACDLPDPPQPNNTIPDTYATKHLPKGWWTDQETIEEGRNLYLGRTKPNVNCATCHGKTGKPTKSGARNFRDIDTMKTFSDSHLFWRISEGVPYSTMEGFRGKLSEDEIWKVIVFVSTLGMDGLQYNPGFRAWVPAG